MLIAVVLYGDLDIFPPHVQVGEAPPTIIENGYLGRGPVESRGNEQQSQPSLFRRLRATIHQIQSGPQPTDISGALVSLRQGPYLRCSQARCVGKRIEVRDSTPTRQVPA